MHFSIDTNILEIIQSKHFGVMKSKEQHVKPHCLINSLYVFTDLEQRINKSSIDVDSLKIRIPYKDVKLIHSEFTDKFSRLNHTTGELEPLENTKTTYDERYGIKVGFNIEKINTGFNKKEGKLKDDFLTIGVSSKCLKEQYFKGINTSTLTDLYNYILSLNIAHFTKESFLQSRCTDIDFKCDFNLKIKTDDFTRILSECAKSSNMRNIGCNRFYQKKNKGIEFQTRSNATSVISHPYLKFYDKRVELMYKSIEFNNAFLQGVEAPQIRCETTIKNKSHLKSLNINDNSLSNIVNLDSNKKTEIVKNAIDRNLYCKASRDVSHLKSLKDMVYDYILLCQRENKVPNDGFFIENYPLTPKQLRAYKSDMKRLSK